MSRLTSAIQRSHRSSEPDPRPNALRCCGRCRTRRHSGALPAVFCQHGTWTSRSRGTRGNTMTIRILLVDDHTVVRTGLRAILDAESDLEVVGEAACGMPAISLARKLRPNVVVTDLLLPDVDGVAVAESFRAELTDTQVVVLTSVSEEDACVVRAIRAGAI